MAAKIPDETIQAIRDRVSIVEVVSSYVTLKKAGRNHQGLCPFHTEKTPSFTVNDERGLFHCFGCGAGGTVFTFVMRMERQEFPEAVATLARRVGIPLPERERGPASQHREQLLRVNNFAAAFYRRALLRPEGERARRYLSERGVAAEIAERFGLGFAPATGTALTRALARKQAPEALAIELGLLGRANDGRVYDRFRGRLMFPIRRHGDGGVIGFGARILDGDGPKYLNSPESVFFHKGKALYGLAEARDAILRANRVVVVEGYLDALALVQAGICETVATLGTALTADHLELLRLRRLAEKNVIIFFDGDAAGQKAAARAFELSAVEDVWAHGAFLPTGFDPDSFVRQRGAEATQQLLQDAIPLFDFYLQRIDPGAHAPVPARASAADEVGRVLKLVKDPVKYDLLVRQTAARLGVSEETLRRSTVASLRAPQVMRPSPATAAVNLPAEEALLVEAMAIDREVAVWADGRGVLPRLRNRDLASVAVAIAHAWQEGHEPASLIDALPASIASRVTAAWLGEGPMASGDRMKIAEDCVARIEQRAQRDLAGALDAELRHSEQHGDTERWREQLARRNQLLRGGSREA